MTELFPSGWADYELIDSGSYEKLERYGRYIIRRPEPQAVWPKRLDEYFWQEKTHAWFRRSAISSDRESLERGEWILSPGMPDRWSVTYGYHGRQWSFRLGMTAFKHIGLFPEQAANWDFIYDKILGLKQANPNVLNLFAYTGGASLVAASAGASVVHVDAVKQVVNWARDNAEANAIKTVHWIVDDALKFVQREVRRGRIYQGLILDPPAYGRGPAGEKWILEQHLPVLLDACKQLLDPVEGFVVLNLYSMGFSSIIAANLLEYYFDRPHKTLEYGELALTDRQGFRLPLSVFARF